MDHEDHLLERLLDGRLPADDTPRDLAAAGRLLDAARAVPPVDPVVVRATVAAMVAEIEAVPRPRVLRRSSKPVLVRLLSTKAAFAAAVLAISATGAAAATGSISEPVSVVLRSVGIDIDDDRSTPTTVTLPSITTTTSGVPSSAAAQAALDQLTTGTSTATTARPDNHGDDVSDVARSTPPGPCHGAVVSEEARSRGAARSKKGRTTTSTSTSTTTTTTTTVPTTSTSASTAAGHRDGRCPTTTTAPTDSSKTATTDDDTDNDHQQDGRRTGRSRERDARKTNTITVAPSSTTSIAASSTTIRTGTSGSDLRGRDDRLRRKEQVLEDSGDDGSP